MRNNKINIAQYALFAQTFLLMAAKSNAEVIYTDIEPDLLLDTLDEVGGIDMNNDGIYDFAFLNGYAQWPIYSSFGDPVGYNIRFCQWAGGYGTPINQIAGDAVYFSAYYGGGFSRYYPFALATSNLINDKLEFQSWGYQRMAFKSYRNDNLYTIFDHIFDSGGYWFPNAAEQFLGVRFQDSDEKIHYGWIRCSVIDSAEGIIIHDYAYETQIEHPILAGSMESYVDVQNSVNNDSYQVYAFNKTIYIVTDEVNPTTTYTIYSIDGKMLKSGLLLEKLMQVELIEYNGACLIEIKINNEATFTKHVVVF
ncbi:MAG: hypothetical protein WBP43_08545 [Chitinophagales bacterium]